MVVQEAPGRHALSVRVGRLQRIGSIGEKQVFAPLMRIVGGEVQRQIIALTIIDAVAATLEVAVARPCSETGMVARVEILTLIVLVGISHTGSEAQVL